MHLHHILHCLQWSSSPRTDPSRDLVLNIYFHDTDTWDSCDMHYLDYMIFLDWPCDFNLWSRVLMILWLCYTRSLYSCHNMHARSSCTRSIIVIIPVLLLLSVPDTVNYIVLIISMPYLYCYCIFIFSLLIFFSFRVLLLVRFWRTFIIFQYLDQKASIESWL